MCLGVEKGVGYEVRLVKGSLNFSYIVRRAKRIMCVRLIKMMLRR